MPKYSQEQLVQCFSSIRHPLLALHKTLLDYQKRIYEGQHGQLRSAQDFYLLAANDPAFAWLRVLTELIVSMDTLSDTPEKLTEQNGNDMLAYLKRLISTEERHTDFEKQYYEALQKDPSIVVAHGEVMKFLANL